ncbi:MAG: 1-acyl-sn-glycerol-3-phosphate acyltransferase [Armatimonadetes bacterium]|nr:1-acyl-sn-glycerol-3-phosphate acyltransferase [Armatimonadota bacterium]
MQVHSTAFDPGVASYYGPPDGRSRSKKFPLATGPAVTAGVSLFCRVETEGLENLPRFGPHVYASNHASVLDVPLLLSLGIEDMRTMVNVDLFQYPVLGRLLTWGGMYPVDRVNPSPISKEHAVEVVKSGKGLGTFPEGDFTVEGDRGCVGPFKKGAAAAAILGGAESVVPIAIDYQPNDKPRYGEQVAGALAAGVVVAGGVLSLGHPALGKAVSLVSGALAGILLGGLAGRSRVETAEPSNPGPQFVAGLQGAAIGGATGAVLAGLAAHDPVLMLGCSLAGGLATLGLAEAWRERPVARVKIGPPIEMQPYLERAAIDRKAAVIELTRELHRRIGHLKEELSGVPYDPTAARITTTRPTIHWKAGTTSEEMRAARA